MSLLSEFVANEVGWEQVYYRLRKAMNTFTERAAMADTHEEHLDQRGQLKGVAHAIALIEQIRRENREMQA